MSLRLLPPPLPPFHPIFETIYAKEEERVGGGWNSEYTKAEGMASGSNLATESQDLNVIIFPM